MGKLTKTDMQKAFKWTALFYRFCGELLWRGYFIKSLRKNISILSAQYIADINVVKSN
ncbi:hypothetical protein KsCSTR_14030 [Candidatus Kuenenia stuttgartiensis]|uniref:Uncharacterized protein n=1 Tax=Kuenenia stuttgartiensis TaxID=174633 RepID=Q1Q163_KUEST|nr:hypothetical protein KsCSTR_14030 [Candidatus Kuenenia stuttgartiensis]CAJ73750.1 unknown protein [Candidatus Kuenenia stuttgartiensis]